MASKSFTTRQPGKFLFTLWTLTINAARLPFWIIYFIPSFLRQHPNWTYKQALSVRILRAALKWMSDVEMVTPFDLKPGKEGNKFIQIRPGNSAKYVGVVAKDAEIQPATIGGTWYPKPPTSATAGNVILHFHGGAYVIGDGRTGDAGFAAKTLLENTPANHVLCPQYRLASNPGGRFPAYLQDAITSLLYLTETLNIPAEKITISGDSAGANLCLTLLRYIHDNPDAKLPNPACAFLWSPWVNPGSSMIQGHFDKSPHRPTDYLNDAFGAWGARCITPSKASGITLASPNIDVQSNPFATPTPLYFSIGESEVLYHDVLTTYDAYKAIPENKLTLEIEKAAVHDIILLGPRAGFEKEAAFGAQKAGEFWKSVIKSS